MNKIVLITGSTAGIGEAIARKFAEEQYDLILTGRREARLNALKEDLVSSNNVKVHTLCFDVRDKDAVRHALSSLPDPWQNIDILINNAGLALGLAPVHEGDFNDWDTMIDTNIKGLLYMSKTIAAKMVKRGKGHIINIGSIAGKEAYPNGNVYVATKHAVEGLTNAMRLDLFNKGIRVSQIAPGAVETEFSMVRFKGDRETADNVYKGYRPLSGEDVAEATWFVASRPAHVTINDLLIMPSAQAGSTFFDKKL
jgi:NADP-dependent 3-hydroxy acid dehydrogenase YdfG